MRRGERPPPDVSRAVLRPDRAAEPRWDAPSTETRAVPSYAGWENEADVLATDLRRVLEGHAISGAFAEARAEAARQDLALYPPDDDRIRRMLLGDERERTRALAALAARRLETDDFVALVLRSHRAEDGELLRLLGAEVLSGVAPELLSRHEDEILRAFGREPNPLVLAIALPALESMREERLRDLMRSQVAIADPEMLPVLLSLARDRLGTAAMASVEETVRETMLNQPGAGDEP